MDNYSLSFNNTHFKQFLTYLKGIWDFVLLARPPMCLYVCCSHALINILRMLKRIIFFWYLLRYLSLENRMCRIMLFYTQTLSKITVYDIIFNSLQFSVIHLVVCYVFLGFIKHITHVMLKCTVQQKKEHIVFILKYKEGNHFCI